MSVNVITHIRMQQSQINKMLVVREIVHTGCFLRKDFRAISSYIISCVREMVPTLNGKFIKNL